MNYWLERRQARLDRDYLVLKLIRRHHAYYVCGRDIARELNLTVSEVDVSLTLLEHRDLIESQLCGVPEDIFYKITTKGKEALAAYQDAFKL